MKADWTTKKVLYSDLNMVLFLDKMNFVNHVYSVFYSRGNEGEKYGRMGFCQD